MKLLLSHQMCFLVLLHSTKLSFEHKQINFQINYNFQTVQMTCALSRYTEAQCHFSGVLNDTTAWNTTFSNDLSNLYNNVPHIERLLTDCRKTRIKVITVTNQKRHRKSTEAILNSNTNSRKHIRAWLRLECLKMWTLGFWTNH